MRFPNDGRFSPVVISTEGQPFYDEPVLVRPARLPCDVELAFAAQEVVGHAKPRTMLELPIPVTRADVLGPRLPITVAYERIALRWVTPDFNGGLVPR